VTLLDVGALTGQRWFGAKDRAVVRLSLVERTPPDSPLAIELVEVAYAAGPPDTYVLLPAPGRLDAFDEPERARALLQLVRDGAELPTEAGGAISFHPRPVLAEVPADATEPVRAVGVEQSNSSLRYGEALMLKLFRRREPGIQPEIEVGRFLSEATGFRNAPALLGWVEHRAADGSTAALAVLQRFVPNRGDAWGTTLGRLAAFLDGGELEPVLAPIRRLGTVTGGLHVALASRPDDPAFAPEPITLGDVQGWAEACDAEVRRAETAAALAHMGQAATGLECLVGSLKTRIHGDYHLGQVLETPTGGVPSDGTPGRRATSPWEPDPRGSLGFPGDFVVIDFEGEPAKPLAARRAKLSPLRDVAGLLRSLDYARHAALRARPDPDSAPAAAERARDWYEQARAAFLQAYLATVRRHQPNLVPADDGAVRSALAGFEREKAAYEVLYELNNRPSWVGIPLAALQTEAPAWR
jgi:predicted trehalose synthase